METYKRRDKKCVSIAHNPLTEIYHFIFAPTLHFLNFQQGNIKMSILKEQLTFSG